MLSAELGLVETFEPLYSTTNMVRVLELGKTYVRLNHGREGMQIQQGIDFWSLI